MKLIAHSRAMVACSPSAAYSLISNMERFSEWFPQVLSVMSNDGLAHGVVGKRYQETVHLPWRKNAKVQLTVKEAVPGRRFITEGRRAPLLPRMEITLIEVAPQRTEVEWRMFSRSRNALVRLLLVPLARPTIQGRADQGLARLKTQLETTRISP